MKKVEESIKVRYQETDQMGVVYHANYLVWFEIGRTKYIENLGLNYLEIEDSEFVSPVTDVNISYKKPAIYGETITVETWLKNYDGIRIVYAYHILKENRELAVSGTTEHVIVSKKTFRPTSLRKSFPNWHKTYLEEIGRKS